MTDFVIDKLTSGLARSGAGPLTTVPKVTIATALDAAGRLTLSTPASDPRNALIVPNALNYIMAVIGGEVGDYSRVGIIRERTTVLAGFERHLRGLNLLDELTYTNVGKLALESAPGSGLPMPAADLLDAILDGTGWTSTGTPSRDVYHRFGDEKTLAALGKLAELTGDHFRLSRTVARRIEWLAAGADGYEPAASGLVAKETADSHVDACLIAKDTLTLVEDGQDRITRLYPRGAGNADAQLYINASTLGTGNPGTGVDGDYVYGDYTLHIDQDEPWKSYIKHTVNDAAGSIGDVVEIRDIVAIANTAPDLESAANELVLRSIVQLRRRLVDQRSFRFRLIGPDLSRLVEGDSIRLQARAYTDGYGYVDVDEDVLLLEVPATISGQGIEVDVQATAIAVDRWPSAGREPVQLTAGALQQLVGSISQLKETAAHEQPVMLAQQATTIADNSVTTPKIAPGAVTPEKTSGIVYVLDVDPATVTVNNTTTETPVWSVTVPGGTLGADGMIRVALDGGVLNNSGGTQILRIRMKYGSTTVLDISTAAMAASLSRRPIHFEARLFAKGAVGAQEAGGSFDLGNAAGTAGITTAIGSTYIAEHDTGISENSDADLVLEITAQWAAAHGNLTFTKGAVAADVVKLG